MTVSFDELISKQFLDPFEEPIPGVGKMLLHPISATLASEISVELEEKEGEELEGYISARALSFVKGSDPTEEEVAAFRKNVRSKSISAIFNVVMSGGRDVLEDPEKVEKN